MATTYRAGMLSALKQNERDMSDMFRGASDTIRGILARNAAGETVPLQLIDTVQIQTANVIMGLFVGRGQYGDMAPLDVIGGKVRPLSPYARILYDSIEAVTRSSVTRHHNDMMRRLHNHPEVLARMQLANANPFTVSKVMVSEQLVFNPNPLAEYDPSHRWVDPNGYRLSDRIWRSGMGTRRYIDYILEDGIRRGISAQELADRIEVFLQPGRKLLRTQAPYGVDASYDAMRLARTEIARAAAHADHIAANLNPFVESYEVVLSASHPKQDICDDWAAGGPYPKSDTEHILPAHPHCLCYQRWVQSENTNAIITDLQREVEKERSALLDIVGPLLIDRLADMLLSTVEVIGTPEAVPWP